VRLRKDLEGHIRGALKTFGIRMTGVSQGKRRQAFRDQRAAAGESDPVLAAIADGFITAHETLCVAAEALEVARGDLAFNAGIFTVQGTDRAITIADIAREACDSGRALAASETFMVDGPGFPNGAHAVEVEVDPETGMVSLVNVVTVIDPGRVINPMIVTGQMHGGIVQGIGEAMLTSLPPLRRISQSPSGVYPDRSRLTASSRPGGSQ